MVGVTHIYVYSLCVVSHLDTKFDTSWRCRKGIPIDRDEGLQVLRLQLSLC